MGASNLMYTRSDPAERLDTRGGFLQRVAFVGCEYEELGSLGQTENQISRSFRDR